MHINFKKVTLHNFMSFGHSELEFLDDGFTKVSGINESTDDMATSNGSGKSSLWEAIIWALTGDTIRGTKQVSNMYGDDGTYVALTFDFDNHTYDIIRSKNHKVYKTSIQIMVDGKDCSGKGVRDSEKLLEQYLPDVTASLLGSVIILGQGLPQKFTNNSPSGRKEVLEKLSKSDFMIEDLKERVNTRKALISTEIRKLQDEIIANDSKSAYIQKQIDDSRETLSTLDKTELEGMVVESETAYNKAVESQSRIATDISAYTNDINQLHEELNSITSKYRSDYQELENQSKADTDNYRQSVYRMKLTIDATKKEISKLKSIKDVCPTCGQHLPNVVKPDTTALERQVEEQSLEMDRVQRLLDEGLHQFSIQANTLKSAYDNDRAPVESKLTKLKGEIEGLQRTSMTVSKQVQELYKEFMGVKTKLTQLESTIQNLTKTIVDGEKELELLELKMKDLVENKATYQSKLDIIIKFETALKRDFRGYLLSTVIDYIQARAKDYAKIIFDTDRIGFYLDGNNIEIDYIGKAYENLSGGEKQKIDLIIQFSIRDMLCNHLGFTSNILVLDEVFDALDVVGCQKVVDLITSISDIKNVFIVTHRKDLSIPYDKELIVVKSPNGISEIKR